MTRTDFESLLQQGPQAFMDWFEAHPEVYFVDDHLPLWYLALQAQIPQLTIALMDHALSADKMDYASGLKLLNSEEQYIFLSFLFSIGNPQYLIDALNAGFSPDIVSPEMQIPVYKTLINQVVTENVRKPLLHSVLSSLNLPMIDVLASRVSDINAVDTLGNTALHEASVILAATEDGHFPLVELLLSYDADKDRKNNDGSTPLAYLDKMLPVYASPEILANPVLQQLRKLLEGSPQIILAV